MLSMLTNFWGELKKLADKKALKGKVIKKLNKTEIMLEIQKKNELSQSDIGLK